MIGLRHQMLAKPIWQGMRDHPALPSLNMVQLRALDSFFEHIARHGLSMFSEADFCAWAALGAGGEGLENLERGLMALNPQDPSLTALQNARVAVQRKSRDASVSRLARRAYPRTVSVGPESLPEDWQEFLRLCRVRRAGGDPTAPAASILQRMTQKLCQYVFALGQSGLPPELHLEGLQAFHAALSTRLSKPRNMPLRPATVRATWEELERFARLKGGYDAGLLAALQQMLEEARDNEAGTVQQKYEKMHGIGTPVEIILDAFQMLSDVSHSQSPSRRHKRRNRAAALALPAILPLRRDWGRLIFGKTLYWSGERYRIRNFRPGKTALLDGRRDFPASIHPRLTPFVDSLILQDDHPKYLEALRKQVEATHRPLFVHPNGLPCAKNYVSRVWSEICGTGATVARTLMHDHFGAKGDDGVRKAMILCDQYAPGTPKYYRGASVHQRLADAAQDDILSVFEEEVSEMTAKARGKRR